MSASAKNMEAVVKAKKHHDANCPWGGEGVRFYMTTFDIERMGWEEGDVLVGMTLLSDPKLTTGRFRVECDAEPKPDQEIVEEVENKDLVSV